MAVSHPKSILRSGKYAAAEAAVTPLSELLMPNKQSRATDSFSDSLSSLGNDDACGCEGEDGTTPPSNEMLLSLSGKDLASAIAVGLLVTGSLAASASALIVVPSATVIMMAGICLVNLLAVANKQLSIAKSAGKFKLARI